MEVYKSKFSGDNYLYIKTNFYGEGLQPFIVTRFLCLMREKDKHAAMVIL